MRVFSLNHENLNKLLIASDAFKDALSSPEVCAALARGIKKSNESIEIVEFPLADGGEGTATILQEKLGLSEKALICVDPLRRPRFSNYYMSPDGGQAFIEMAAAAGLQQLLPEERNPMYTTTLGTGIMITDAIQHKAEEIIIAIGGSATNDAGMGLASALGWKFYDEHDRQLEPLGMNLRMVRRVVPPSRPIDIKTRVICDVQNPLYGPKGAARVYAPQKGASPEEIELLEEGLVNFSRLIENALGKPGLSETPGAGAAGGMGFGTMAFLNAVLQPGVDMVMDLCGFDDALMGADLVLTGEGAIDEQTLNGKLVKGVCKKAAAYSVPVYGFCGKLSANEAQLKEIGLEKAFSINEGMPELPLKELLEKTAERLEKSAFAAVELLNR